MLKFWRVIRYEYWRQVRRRGFLMALLSVPLLLSAFFLIGFLFVQLESRTEAVAYIDEAGIMRPELWPPAASGPPRPVEMIALESETEARRALEAGEIPVYYVLDRSYIETGRVRQVYVEAPGDEAEDQFRDFVRASLLAGQPPEVQARLTEGLSLDVRSADGRRQVSEGEWLQIFLPILAGLAFIIAIFITSGYLLQAVVDEKENRTMEILVTSVSPAQLIAGKVVGITGLGITQILVWTLFGAAAVWLGRGRFEWLAGVRLTADGLVTLVLIFLPGYLLIAALMATIGATVTEAREGQQITGLITLPVMIPYWLFGQIMLNPNSPLAVALSFFPLTAPVALSMRTAFAVVPAWQMVLGIALLSLSAAGSLWLAARAFRIGMLRYGQRLSLRELVRIR